MTLLTVGCTEVPKTEIFSNIDKKPTTIVNLESKTENKPDGYVRLAAKQGQIDAWRDPYGECYIVVTVKGWNTFLIYITGDICDGGPNKAVINESTH